MEQQNSNPNTTPQDQQQKCPYNLQTNSKFNPMPAGVYDSRRGRYLNEDQQIFHLMLDECVWLDLLDDMPAALNKWSIKSPLISDHIDTVIMLQKRAELPKEIQDRANEAYDNYKIVNETFKTQTKYKEALQLLNDETQLQNKDLIQIITLYYFVTSTMTTIEPAPLTDEQRAGLIATAQEMDKVYTNTPSVNQKYYLDPEYANVPQEYTEAREFFAYFPFISFYCCYKEFKDLPLDETADHIAEPRQLSLPLLQHLELTKYMMINNTAINDMSTLPLINGDPHDVYVFGDKSDITTYIAISCEPDPEIGIEINMPRKLSPYKRTLTNGVLSLFVAGKEKGQDKPIFSDEMLYRAMPGAGEKLSPQQKAAMTKALNELRATHMTIDATDELRKRGLIGPNEKWERDGYFLSLTRDTYRAQNGRTVHAYRIDAEPLMYTYARLTKQLLTVPVKCLDIRRVKDGQITDKAVGMNEDRQALTDILLRRIALMKQDAHNKKQKQSHTILFSSLFETADLSNVSKERKMDYRNFVFEVLEYQAAIGYIKGYKKQTKGRAITGIEIKL